jgi:hypothetical protein
MVKEITTYSMLRTDLQNRDKFGGCIKVERAPLIHEGFPGAFNLSFTEYHWLKEYGKYIDFDHDFIFSTVQSCIRPDDILLVGTEKSWKYLGVFEMADLSGAVALKTRDIRSLSHADGISSLVYVLQELDIPSEKIYPSYFAGGKVVDLTKGRYPFDFNIPEDEVSVEEFLGVGIPEENLIPDRTTDTFLAVNLKREEQNWGVSTVYTGWGYRNEIHVDVGPKGNKILLDIGTFERFYWRPIYKGDRIIGLGNITCDFSIGAIGLERLCMAANELPRIQDVDYIAPFYEKMRQLFGGENLIAGESLRVLHRIYSDIVKLSIADIGRHRKARINKLLKNIPKSFSLDSLTELLQVHSQTQPWHTNLEQGIEPTIERIAEYRAAKLR